jgi:hypothetical protein
VVVLLASGLGYSLATRTSIVLIVVAVLCGGAVLATAPTTLWPALTLLTIATVPSLLFLQHEEQIGSLGPVLSGQGRALMLLALALVARLWWLLPSLQIRREAAWVVTAYAALVVFEVVSGVLGGRSNVAFADLPRVASYSLAVVVGYLARTYAKEKDISRVLYEPMGVVAIAAAIASVVYWIWLGVSFAVPAPLGQLFNLLRPSSLYEAGRSVFPFVDDSPNLGASAVVSMAAFAVPVMLLSGRRRGRFLACALLGATTLAVLSTGSRSGFLALGVGAATFVALSRRLRRRESMIVVVALSVLAVFAATSFAPRTAEISSTTGTLLAREGIWHQAVTLIAERPITGWGFHYATRSVFVEAPSPGGAATRRLSSVHNEYLAQLVDGGVLGMFGFSFMLALLVRVGLRMRAHPSTEHEGIAFLSFLAALGLVMFAGTPLESSVSAILFWLFTGVALAAAPAGGEH